MNTTNAFHDSNRDDRVDATIAEYLNSVEDGKPLPLEDFLHRHIEIAAELRAFLEDQAPSTPRPGTWLRLPPRPPALPSATSAITNSSKSSPAAAWASSTKPGNSASTASSP